MLQANSLALTRTEGQDTQRAFASARWDLRKLTRWGQEVTFTAYARGDLYNTHDTLETTVARYRGEPGFNNRAIGALAVAVKRSEERRVGKEWVQRCRSRWSPSAKKKNKRKK